MTQHVQGTEGAAPATMTLRGLLDLLPQARQRQDGTDAQLETVEATLAQHGGQDLPDWEKAIVANRLGAYDAGDLYKIRAAKVSAPAR
jgi:hypothetical protein